MKVKETQTCHGEMKDKFSRTLQAEMKENLSQTLSAQPTQHVKPKPTLHLEAGTQTYMSREDKVYGAIEEALQAAKDLDKLMFERTSEIDELVRERKEMHLEQKDQIVALPTLTSV